MVKYTFSFEKDEQAKFARILSRLDPEEYNIIKEIYDVTRTNKFLFDKETIMEMDPEAALTFRLGMKTLNLRHERTEEELAAEKELEDKNTIRITVQVPPNKS